MHGVQEIADMLCTLFLIPIFYLCFIFHDNLSHAAVIRLCTYGTHGETVCQDFLWQVLG